MNLAQLEYFEAVYARRSYATAAKDIPMSHQGLLKSMVALQGELGVPLFCTAEGSSTVPLRPMPRRSMLLRSTCGPGNRRLRLSSNVYPVRGTPSA